MFSKDGMMYMVGSLALMGGLYYMWVEFVARVAIDLTGALGG